MNAHLPAQPDDLRRELRQDICVQLEEIHRRRADFEDLLFCLRKGATSTRLRAAKSLREYGSWAIESLCLVLQDKDLNVRAAAAESLGHIGDERAIQPLIEALRRCFLGRSVYWQFIVGLLVMPLLILLIVKGMAAAGAVALVGCFSQPFIIDYQERREASKLCQIIVDALVRIAEHCPTPELRAVIPDLRAIAADVLQQEKQARAASRQAAQRIEDLTEQLKNLPLPAAAPAPDAATLPRAAAAPAPNVEALPRVR